MSNLWLGLGKKRADPGGLLHNKHKSLVFGCSDSRAGAFAGILAEVMTSVYSFFFDVSVVSLGTQLLRAIFSKHLRIVCFHMGKCTEV